MTIKPKYKTKQREELISYLETVAGEHVTAGDVCEYFKAKGKSVSQATVYRQLESRPGSNLKQSYQAGIIRNTERIALLVAQLILKGTIISVVPANKMIFRTGIGNDCDVVTIEIRTTTGQSADRIV